MANRNSTNVLVKYKEKMGRNQAAAMLQTIATKLKEEGSFTLHQGEHSQIIQPAETVTVEIELEERNGKYEFEFELEWHEGAEKAPLKIE
ncbi:MULTISPECIES: amphi-Trp domain-containing protein [Clostridia]|uniref:amphi-Trp domain-containing protein n=1 Tax=Clostridia TaxID=186801 RepID=UPI000EA1DC65|nr:MULTISPECIES: amphi-Trp domain-containing protein [Clostridia]NBJ69772.1 amphi-Trp domain-containing protein [Roseburia sp. 1XD42-34]RKI77846.1 amphi-Trp domain-containing protein [Clostridium sp. 1xD42-85]